MLRSFNAVSKRTLLALLPLSLSWLTGCSPAEFKMYNDATGTNVSQGVPGTPVICDPFDPTNIISPTGGLKGSIYYLDATQPRYQTSADYIAHGTKVNADLFLNHVDVRERDWDSGFVNDSGVGIKDNNGNLLAEYFALNLESKLKLGPLETAGDYQLAVISDDGSTLSLKNTAGVLTPIVQHEGDHSTIMKCASQVVTMTATSEIPLQLGYYQGPRNRIALTVMWRKVPAGGSLSESECDHGGDDYFYNHGTSTAAATTRAPYDGLISRGWKPLSNDNFVLQSGRNLCVI